MTKQAFEVINQNDRNGHVVSVWDTRNQAEDECKRLRAITSSTRVHYRVQEKKVKE